MRDVTDREVPALANGFQVANVMRGVGVAPQQRFCGDGFIAVHALFKRPPCRVVLIHLAVERVLACRHRLGVMGIDLFSVGIACCCRPGAVVLGEDIADEHDGSAGGEEGGGLGDQPSGCSGPPGGFDQVIGNQGQQAYQPQADQPADQCRLTVGVTVEGEHGPVPEVERE
ncbi:hypothetical protein D3C71_1591580 [compost metagenome]